MSLYNSEENVFIGMTKYISVGFYYSGTSNFGCDKETQFLYKHKDEQFRRYPGHADAINEAIKALVDMVNENMSIKQAIFLMTSITIFSIFIYLFTS